MAIFNSYFDIPRGYNKTFWGWTLNIHNLSWPGCQGDSTPPHRKNPDFPSHKKIQMPLLVTSPKSSWPLLEVDFPKKTGCCENSQCFGELGFVRSQQAAKVKPWTQHSWPKNLRKMPGKWEEKMGNWKNGWICLRCLLGCSMLFQFLGWKTTFGKPDVWCWRSLQSSAAYFSGAAPGKRNDWCSNWI